MKNLLLILLLLFSLLSAKNSVVEYYQGELFLKKGEYSTAINQFNQTLNMIKKDDLYGQFMIYDDLAVAYKQLSNFKKSQFYLIKSLEIKRKLFGENHIKTALAYTMVAFLSTLNSDLRGAIESYLNALKIFEWNNKELDIMLISSKLGSIYQDIGEYQKSLKYMKKSLHLKEKIFGKNSLKTADSYNDLGLLYEARGEYLKSLKSHLKTLHIVEKLVDKKSMLLARSYNNLALIYGTMGDNSEALESLNKALLIAENQQRIETAKIYNNLSNAYHVMGEYNKAIVFSKKSLAINRKLLGEYHIETAKIYNNLSVLYQDLGKYTIALEYLLKSLRVREKILGKNNLITSNSYNNLGILYGDIGDYALSLKYYQWSLRIKKKKLNKNHPLIGVAYNNICSIYIIQNHYKEALKFCLKALEINQISLGKEHRETAKVYDGLGLIYYKIGKNIQAEKFYLKALTIQKHLSKEENIEIANSYNNLGSVYHSLKLYNKALKFTKQSLAIYLKKLNPNNPTLARVYNNLSAIYCDINLIEKGLTYQNKALTINRKIFGKEHISVALNYNNLGGLYQKKKNYMKALEHYKKSLKIYKKKLGHNSLVIANSYHNIASIYQLVKKYKDSYNYSYKAIAVYKSNLAYSYTELVNVYNTLAQTYFILKEYKKAYKYHKIAFDIEYNNRKNDFSILDKKEKQTYLKNREHHLPVLFKSSYQLKNPNHSQEILTVWLNHKRTIFDGENSIQLIYNKTKDENLKSKIDELFNRERQLSRLYQNLPQNKNEIKIYNKKIAWVKEEISTLEKFLSSKIELLKQKDITYQDISKLLKPKELYIDFAYLNKNYYLFTLDKSKNITFQKLDAETINKIIKSIQTENQNIIDGTTFANIKKAKEQYGKLYNLIFSEIDINNKKSLIISPDGLLSLIPFEAFYDKKEKKYLIEKVKINYIPSGKELVNLYKKSEVSNNKVVVFANPDFGLNSSKEMSKFRRGTVEALYEQAKGQNSLNQLFKPLNGTQKEALAIKKLYPNSQIYKDKEASEANFFKISQPKILHLSTHGFFLKDEKVINPMLKSGIALSGANYAIKNQNGEGIVTALEISGLNLNGTELVVLSACETGVGEVEEAEGVAGINKAFMKAGARYIVMSLWSVSDNATAILMKKFYGNIKENSSYGIALREAKIEMIKNGKAHPYYWSGFVGSGVDR